MNALFSAIFIAAAVIFCLNDPTGFLPALLTGAERAATLTITLLSSYCIWLGFFKVMEQSGLSDALSKRMLPFSTKLFASDDRGALTLACQNIAANLLGLPGAPTPLGVAATKKFLAANNEYAADMLFVLNATGLQLLPTTVIALRAAQGAANAADILLPTLAATLLSTLLGALLVRFTARHKKGNGSPLAGHKKERGTRLTRRRNGDGTRLAGSER